MLIMKVCLAFREKLLAIIANPTGSDPGDLLTSRTVLLVSEDFDEDTVINTLDPEPEDVPETYASSGLAGIVAAIDTALQNGIGPDGELTFEIPAPLGGFRWELDSFPGDVNPAVIHGLMVKDTDGNPALILKLDEPVELVEVGNVYEITNPGFTLTTS